MITYGSDPELFAQRDGLFVPAYVAMGNADQEHYLSCGELVADGAALEFTVTPTGSIYELLENIGTNLIDTNTLIQTLSGSELSAAPSANFAEWIPQFPPDYGPRCSLQILGCDPDICAYGPPLERPDPVAYPYRTTGGHLHFGIGVDLVNDERFLYYLIAHLDRTIGALSTMYNNSDGAKRRKELYGRAGYYRVNYNIGTVEYRTMPAMALLHSPDVTEMLLRIAEDVVTWCVDANNLNTLHKNTGGYGRITACQEAIDNHDVRACRDLFLEYVSKGPIDSQYELAVLLNTDETINLAAWGAIC